MILTADQIEKKAFELVKRMFEGVVGGAVYRGADARPTNAKGEDIVVSLLAKTNAHLQRGTVLVRFYIPMKQTSAGRLIRDTKRVDALEAMALTIPMHDDTGLDLSLGDYAEAEDIADIRQTVLPIRLSFSRLTD